VVYCADSCFDQSFLYWKIYSTIFFWNFDFHVMEVPDMKVPDMEVFSSRQNEPIKINQHVKFYIP
jgi:hypothetical protein